MIHDDRLHSTTVRKRNSFVESHSNPYIDENGISKRLNRKGPDGLGKNALYSSQIPGYTMEHRSLFLVGPRSQAVCSLIVQPPVGSGS
jgi:hypothetical protein